LGKEDGEENDTTNGFTIPHVLIDVVEVAMRTGSENLVVGGMVLKK